MRRFSLCLKPSWAAGERAAVVERRQARWVSPMGPRPPWCYQPPCQGWTWVGMPISMCDCLTRGWRQGRTSLFSSILPPSLQNQLCLNDVVMPRCERLLTLSLLFVLSLQPPRLLTTKCHEFEQVFCTAASSVICICLISIFRTRFSQGLN